MQRSAIRGFVTCRELESRHGVRERLWCSHCIHWCYCVVQWMGLRRKTYWLVMSSMTCLPRIVPSGTYRVTLINLLDEQIGKGILEPRDQRHWPASTDFNVSTMRILQLTRSIHPLDQCCLPTILLRIINSMVYFPFALRANQTKTNHSLFGQIQCL
jgi:hypothetical protein